MNLTRQNRIRKAEMRLQQAVQSCGAQIFVIMAGDKPERYWPGLKSWTDMLLNLGITPVVIVRRVKRITRSQVVPAKGIVSFNIRRIDPWLFITTAARSKRIVGLAGDAAQDIPAAMATFNHGGITIVRQGSDLEKYCRRRSELEQSPDQTSGLDYCRYWLSIERLASDVPELQERLFDKAM